MKVFGIILITNDQSTKVMKPSEQAFHLPTALIAAKRSAILGRVFPPCAMWRDQFDVPTQVEPKRERVAIVGLVANESFRFFGREDLIECFLDQGYFVGRSACDTSGERKTIAVCNGHDFTPLPAFGLPNAKPPFLAPVKEPSMKASERSRPPRSSRSWANARRIFFMTPDRTHPWKRRWQVWYGGYRSGRSFQGAPVRCTHKIPLRTSRLSLHGRPRPSVRRGLAGISGSKISHCSFVKSISHNFAPKRMDLRHL